MGTPPRPVLKERGGSNKPVGPFSPDHRLLAVDKRTKFGRVIHETIVGLTDDIGGNPSTAQSILIKRTAVLNGKLALMDEDLLCGSETSTTQNYYLAWNNSLRHNLLALGLERRTRDITPSLGDILNEHDKKRGGGTPP